MKVECAFDEMIDLDLLVSNPKNPNKHPDKQIKMLAKIMKHQGWRSPIVVSNRSGFITKGHGRMAAAMLNRWTKAPVDKQDYASEADEYADMVADNKIAELADSDMSMIIDDVKLLGDDFDTDLLGIPEFEIPELTEAQCDEDEVPEHVKPSAKLGDIYQLGRHRLMCGDSTSISDLDQLMYDERADICFTSPPYNVGKTPNGNTQKYLNDGDDRDSSEFCDLLSGFTQAALTVSDYVFVNIQSLSGNKVALIDYLHAMKVNYADTIIWDKLTAEPAMAKNVLNSRFEYVHVFSHQANRVIGSKEFRGIYENVFPFNSRKDKEFSHVHKATFPVAFAEHFVSSFSEKSVLDPFGGAGSTLIACEKTNRKCFMMELDPHYIDVIIARWENYTGKKANLIK